jgi:hypothetical protein
LSVREAGEREHQAAAGVGAPVLETVFAERADADEGRVAGGGLDFPPRFADAVADAAAPAAAVDEKIRAGLRPEAFVDLGDPPCWSRR